MVFRARRQLAVLWPFVSHDENGEPLVGDPVELTVRWEKGLSQEITPNTNPIAVTATIWVDREIENGSMMRIGSLDEVTGTGTGTEAPPVPDEILEVVDYQEIPDIKGRVFERVVLCQKYADGLPHLFGT